MKNIYFSILLIFLLNCIDSVKTPLGKLHVKIEYCKYTNNENPFLGGFKLFKDKTEIQEIELELNNQIIIPNLKPGKYYIEYKTLFNRIETIPLIITASELEIAIICFDFMDYKTNKNVLLVDNLQIEKPITIYFESNGCFHKAKNKMSITKTKNNYIIKYNNIDYLITENQFKLIKEFEIELRSNHTNGCTTQEIYRIGGVDYEEYHFTDGSCNWHGFRNLIGKLNLTK